jgi:hypothetical protein
VTIPAGQDHVSVVVTGVAIGGPVTVAATNMFGQTSAQVQVTG